MLKKKDWKELLQEFIDKVNKREELIQSKIDGLQEQAASIQAKIQENSDQMIDLEMNEDFVGVEKFKKENRKLRTELEEIQDSIAGYKSQLGTSRDHFAKDLDKVREAANRADEEQKRWLEESISKRKALEAEIEELTKQVKEINFNLQISRTAAEEMDSYHYLIHIEPRALDLKEYLRPGFLKSWLQGRDDTEDQYFKNNI